MMKYTSRYETDGYYQKAGAVQVAHKGCNTLTICSDQTNTDVLHILEHQLLFPGQTFTIGVDNPNILLGHDVRVLDATALQRWSVIREFITPIA